MLRALALLSALTLAVPPAVAQGAPTVLVTEGEAAEAAACWAEAPALRAGYEAARLSLDSLRADAREAAQGAAESSAALRALRAAQAEERAACARLTAAHADEADALRARLRRAALGRWAERGLFAAAVAYLLAR